MIFSVIVPTFNRPDSLRRCLAALARLKFAKASYNVIVVDDGGSVDLLGIIAAFEPIMNTSLIRQCNAGPACARNTGARHSISRFLAFTDDDCEPSENWLCALQESLEASPDALIGGRVINGLSGNRYAVASQIVYDYCYLHLNSYLEKATFFSSNNLALAKDLYDRLGGFDVTFKFPAGEDRDFCDRFMGLGWKLKCAPDATVVHYHQMGLHGFWRQHFGYGRGGCAYAIARRRRNRGHFPFGGWRFHLGLVFAPFHRARHEGALRLSALTFLSQAAVLAGYATEALHMFAPSDRLRTADPSGNSF